jgi:hypothetical protein
VDFSAFHKVANSLTVHQTSTFANSLTIGWPDLGLLIDGLFKIEGMTAQPPQKTYKSYKKALKS